MIIRFCFEVHFRPQIFSNDLSLEQGKQLHSYVIERGVESSVVLDIGLVDMYVKCGNVEIAHKLFERILKRNVVLWNANIIGYSQNGNIIGP